MVSTGVFWDVENCSIPTQLRSYEVIKRRISASLRLGGIGVEGGLTVRAFGNVKKIGDDVRRQFKAAGVDLIDVPSGGGVKRNGSDVMLISNMHSWSRENPKGNILLIAGDSDYVETLKFMEEGGHKVMIAGKWDASELLMEYGQVLWNWPNIVLLESGSSPIYYRNPDESNPKERLGPINVVIRILQILQPEHVFPTLENIKECYDARAELNSRNNISIADALQWACDHKKVTIECTRVPSHGNISLYRLADSHLGICSNPKVGTNIDYIEVWPLLQTFLLNNIGGGNRLEPGKSMFEFAEILRRKFFNVCNFGERFLIGDILTVIHVMLKPKLNGGLEWMGNRRAEEWAPNFKMRNIRKYKEEDIVGVASRP